MFDGGFFLDTGNLELCFHGDEGFIGHFGELAQGEFIGACFDDIDVPGAGDFFELVDFTIVPGWVAYGHAPVLGAELGGVLGGVAEVEADGGHAW